MNLRAPRLLLDRAWRIVATGSSFAVFGLSALGLSLTVFPVIALIHRDTETRSRKVQYCLHLGCRCFLHLTRALGLLSWEVHDEAKLRAPGQLVIANHPSLIDVLFLLSWMPQADCIMKQSLARNPFLRRTVAQAGYIGNASPEGLIDDCVARLQAGRSLIVFPEGTRSVPGRTPVHRRGAARIALAAGTALRPVRIRCVPAAFTKNAAWWRVPAVAPRYRFEIAEPFTLMPARGHTERMSAAARRLTEQLAQVLDPVALERGPR